MTKEDIKLVIIGSGPAGYTAAIYAARAGLNPVLYTGGQPGGQLTITTDVENYPGYPEGINGPQMMIDFQKQAERFDTDVRYGQVTSVDFSSYPLKLVVDEKNEVTAQAVIISTGAAARYLGLPSEQRLMNKGVSACAVCDGFFFKGQEVAVVGDNPMDKQEVEDKAYDLLSGPLGESKTRDLIDRIWTIEQVANMCDLRPMLMP